MGTRDLAEEAKYWSGKFWSERYSIPESKLHSALLLNSLEHLSKYPQPLILQSTHDNPIAVFLASLGVWDGHWPTYAQMIVVEIYEMAKSEPHIRFILRGKPLRIPGCPADSDLCPASTFFGLLEYTKPGENCHLQ